MENKIYINKMLWNIVKSLISNHIMPVFEGFIFKKIDLQHIFHETYPNRAMVPTDPPITSPSRTHSSSSNAELENRFPSANKNRLTLIYESEYTEVKSGISLDMKIFNWKQPHGNDRNQARQH